MKFKIKPYSLYELGARANQEDYMFPLPKTETSDDRLFMVCDGMGGHEMGEVASQTVCETMSCVVLENSTAEGEFTDDCLREALSAAFDALDAKDNGAEKKMGTTMTFLKLHEGGATVAHIGDSRVYHVRPNDKILFQTKDHSLVNDLIKVGELTPEEAKTFPRKNVITRAMQPCLDRRPRADIKHITDIEAGDYFLLCSDGLLEEMDNENLLFILSMQNSDEEKMEILRKNSEQNRDNHSAFLIHILEVTDMVRDVVDEVTPALPDHPENQQKDVPEKEVIPHKDELEPESQNKQCRHSLVRKILFYVVLFAVLFFLWMLVFNYFIKSDKKGEVAKTETTVESGNAAPEAQRNADEAAEAQRKADEAAETQRKAAEAKRKADEAVEAQRKATEAKLKVASTIQQSVTATVEGDTTNQDNAQDVQPYMP